MRTNRTSRVGERWVCAAAALFLAISSAWTGSVEAQGSSASGAAESLVTAPGSGDPGKQEGSEEALFGAGPREPGVLIAAGMLIAGSAGREAASSLENDDAVARLVASVTGGGGPKDPGPAEEEESAAPEDAAAP